MKKMQNTPEMAQALKLLDKPGEFITQLAITVAMMFFMWTLLSVLGGIIGARMSSRGSSHR